ncbi:MAG: hypothetical protein Kow00109_08570 [Acidobacteriota bacterium]
MKITRDELILRRVAREIPCDTSVLLGPGLPERLVDFRPPASCLRLLRETPVAAEQVWDVVVTGAVEVSSRGDLVHSPGQDLEWIQARRWIVAGYLLQGGTGKLLVRECRYPITRRQCVHLVVTEFGVIGITPVGFELRELAPGAAADAVRLAVGGSLHVADDLKLMSVA